MKKIGNQITNAIDTAGSAVEVYNILKGQENLPQQISAQALAPPPEHPSQQSSWAPLPTPDENVLQDNYQEYFEDLLVFEQAIRIKNLEDLSSEQRKANTFVKEKMKELKGDQAHVYDQYLLCCLLPRYSLSSL